MEEASFMMQTLSVLSLLIICSFSYILSKKINFPYTVLLVLVGIILVPISQIGIFSFIGEFKLTPDLLFFVFLPVLLFEAAYNINYRQLITNWKTITWLAVFWLLISAIIVSTSLYFIFPFFGLEIPFLVCLLFWTLISSTDPVAVLSIFKSLWAPRRLTILFEWESLFNDWTSVALFFVILWLILEWWIINSWTFLSWSFSFLSMVFWWFLFGGFMWILFSKVVWYIKNNEEVEIVLTMLLAHITFILAELLTHFIPFLPISAVISTVVASLIIWNYWRYKITPRVEIHMQKFWEFFAFISNSIVFILMWLILSNLEIDFTLFIWPILTAIFVVMIARVFAVFIPIWIINWLSLEEKIPKSWMILLSWWSLRWAIALVMVLLIPWPWDAWYEQLLAFQNSVGWTYDFSIKDFIMVLTIWSIMFTLFIKATTIPALMRKFKVDKLHQLEEFEYEEGKILANLKILQKLNTSFKKAYLTQVEFDELQEKYSLKLNTAVSNMKNILNTKWCDSYALTKRALSLHALGIEKQYLKELFFYNEIDEKNFKYILRKVEKQIERLEKSNEQLRKISNMENDYDIFSRFVFSFYKKRSTELDSYIRNRTRVIITRKVIKELRLLWETELWFDQKMFDETIELYANFNKQADEKRIKIFASHRATINAVESRLINKSLLKLEEKTIKDLYNKEIITPKLYIKFMEEIETEMFSDVKKFS